MNRSDLRHIVHFRHTLFKAVRQFFDSTDYLEVDAPILIKSNAVEEEIDPVSVQIHDPLKSKPETLYLMTSPEIFLKRLLSRGLSRIYYLGHVFRDNERSPIHRPEFTMLEWYRSGATIESLIQETENLFFSINDCFQGEFGYATGFDRQTVQPFEVITMAYAWEYFAGIDLLECLYQISKGDQNALVRAVLDSGENLREGATFEDAFVHIMLKRIEPKIGRTNPTAITHWPAQMASLARLTDANPLTAERFEIYWKGVELANGYAELTDPEIQLSRFESANVYRNRGGKEQMPVDHEFLQDLGFMPPSCGIALGIDRLLCLLTHSKDLALVRPFDLFESNRPV